MKELSEAACRQGELWNQGATDWAAIQEVGVAPLWSAVLDAAEVGPGTRFLDAGCGAGGASTMAAQREAEVFGVDPSVNMITIARERLPRSDFRIGELEELPFSNGEFDAAVAINSLQFVANPQIAVHELGRVCKPGGRVVVATFADPEACDVAIVHRAILELAQEPKPASGPFSLSAPSLLKSLFDAVSLVEFDGVTEVECAHTYPDVETGVRGFMSAGPTRRALDLYGESAVREAIESALQQFRQADGSVRMVNRFRVARGIADPGGAVE